MPAGVSWGQYLKFLSCAMVSMMAGSQLVHMYYKPLEDLTVYIEREKENAHKKNYPLSTNAPSTSTTGQGS